MGTINKFEELDCWKEARKLVRMVYELIEKYSISSYRLVDQLTGAAISSMNNIAEGFDSQTNPEFIRFLKIARRSVSEVQSMSYVLLDIHLIQEEDREILFEQCVSTRKVIDGMLRYLRKKQQK